MADRLFLDRREELAGQPGLHALVVGVSAYKLPTQEHLLKPHHLGMLQLNTAALTAFRLAEWLVERREYLTVPLASCRVLVSSTRGERKRAAGLEKVKNRATLKNFRAAAERWREDGNAREDNVTLFYFAGHGIQRHRQDHVLLLDEFGKEAAMLLEYGIATTELLNGMGPARRGRTSVAGRQIYFIDACRNLPIALNDVEEPKVTGLWDVGVLAPDFRKLSYFFATGEGYPAFEVPKERTVFGAALLDCLRGGAAAYDPKRRCWCITLGSLRDGLRRHIQELNVKHKISQDFNPVGVVEDLLLHTQNEAVLTPVAIAIDPTEGGKYAEVSIHNHSRQWQWHLRPPISMAASNNLPVGYYTVEARVDPPTEPYSDYYHDILEARMPRTAWTIPLLKPA